MLIGQEAVEHLRKQQFIDNRRKDVDDAWANYVLAVLKQKEQNDLKPLRHEFESLFKQTDAFVKREARRWAKSCRKYRLYFDDFESEFRIVVLRAALRYDAKRGYFFDYLRGSIENAGRDLIRKALTRKRSINHLAFPLEVRYEQMPSADDIEAIVIAKITVEQLSNDPRLTNAERHLLTLLKQYPCASNRELSDLMGYSHREKVRRLKLSLRKKGRRYFEAD